MNVEPDVDRAVAEASEPTPKRVSQMTFPELVTFATALGNKIDTLWHRIIYIHVGMIAVIIFLANAPGDHVVARIAVFGFYTFNVIITFVNLNEAYGGLVAAIADIRRFEARGAPGAVQGWLTARDYGNNTRLRAAVLFVFWLVVAYLIVVPLASGTDMALHERIQTFLGISPPRR
ncbi:MAG: hypothetical protein ABL307_14065 [Roseitalea porphyridii]|uniref:hypothetical protein n=1 Tax=Roseitalea porphyridii TaxID=1852022 RepID=UPI0032D8BB0A